MLLEINSAGVGEGREEIDGCDESIVGLATRDRFRIARDARDARPAFQRGPLLSAIGIGLGLFGERFRTVIGEEDDNCILLELFLLERRQEFAARSSPMR